MNLKVFYAARKEFRPLYHKWPDVEKIYEFASFLKMYGWRRPSIIFLCTYDDNTKLENLIEQISFDFNMLSKVELHSVRVCLESDQTLKGACKFKELGEHAYLEYDTAIILSPDEKTWYCLARENSKLYSL